MPRPRASTSSGPVLIRIGGGAVLATFAIHIFVNFFLKEFPAPGLSAEELSAYFDRESGVWGIVHGLRYLAVAGLSVFVAGCYMRLSPLDGSASSGWEIVGLIGGILHVASLFITNGIETFVFADVAAFSGNPEMFWTVFQLTRVLYTGEIAAWGLLLAGFSLAGWYSARLPKPICLLGFVGGAAALLSAMFIGPVLQGGWAGSLIMVAELATLAWFVAVGVFMLVRGGT